MDRRVVLIEVDDRSLLEMGERWPVARDTWARFIDRVAAFEPAITAIDVLFDQPSPFRELELAERLLAEVQAQPGLSERLRNQLNEVVEKELTARDRDRSLAQAIANHGGVVLGAFVRGQWPAGLVRQPARPPVRLQVDKPENLRLQGTVIVESLSRFAVSARASGGLNVMPDPDGLIRRYPLSCAVDGHAYASLALAAVLESGAAPQIGEVADIDGGLPRLRFGERQAMKRLSFIDVLQAGDDAPHVAAALRGAIVFVGVTASGLHEQFATPVDVAVPGVELHATAASNLLSGHVGRAGWPQHLAGLLWLATLLAILLAWLSRSATISSTVRLSAVLVAAHGFGWWLVADQTNWLLPLVTAPLALAAVVAAEALARHEALLRQRRQVQQERRVAQAKSDFLSTVSHELRTPLTAIGGSLKLVQAGAVGPIAETARGMIEMALRNTDRLGRLVNDILDVQKMEAGRMEFDFAEVDLQAVVQDAAAALTTYADGFDVRLEVHGEEGVMVRGDEGRLVQAINNFASNAVKFSPRGERVTLRVSRRGGTARVEVIDRGPGIPENFRARIFQRFAQASAASDHPSGTGLGLSIARMLIERHDGEVGFDTEVGKGTTFWFEIPALGDLQPASSRPRLPSGIGGPTPQQG